MRQRETGTGYFETERDMFLAMSSVQLLSAALCILPTASYGAMLTYVSVGLPQFLNSNNNNNNNTLGVFMTQEEATWFGEK